jgi:hypothetical protein
MEERALGATWAAILASVGDKRPISDLPLRDVADAGAGPRAPHGPWPAGQQRGIQHVLAGAVGLIKSTSGALVCGNGRNPVRLRSSQVQVAPASCRRHVGTSFLDIKPWGHTRYLWQFPFSRTPQGLRIFLRLRPIWPMSCYSHAIPLVFVHAACGIER